MRHISMIALLVLIGCSPRSDPAGSRLEAGSEAITYDPDSSDVLARTPRGTGDLGDGRAIVAVGSRVVVVSDDSDAKGEYEEGRPVRVNVKEGQYRGPATIGRRNLRPAPR